MGTSGTTTPVTGIVAREDAHEFSTDHGNFTPKKVTQLKMYRL